MEIARFHIVYVKASDIARPWAKTATYSTEHGQTHRRPPWLRSATDSVLMSDTQPQLLL